MVSQACCLADPAGLEPTLTPVTLLSGRSRLWYGPSVCLLYHMLNRFVKQYIFVLIYRAVAPVSSGIMPQVGPVVKHPFGAGGDGSNGIRKIRDGVSASIEMHAVD